MRNSLELRLRVMVGFFRISKFIDKTLSLVVLRLSRPRPWRNISSYVLCVVYSLSSQNVEHTPVTHICPLLFVALLSTLNES